MAFACLFCLSVTVFLKYRFKKKLIASVSPPGTKGGGNTCLWVRGRGEPILTTGEKALYILCGPIPMKNDPRLNESGSRRLRDCINGVLISPYFLHIEFGGFNLMPANS